jgi:hypothetical protein
MPPWLFAPAQSIVPTGCWSAIAAPSPNTCAVNGGRYGAGAAGRAAGYQTLIISSRGRPGTYGSSRRRSTRCNSVVPTGKAPVGRGSRIGTGTPRLTSRFAEAVRAGVAKLPSGASRAEAMRVRRLSMARLCPDTNYPFSLRKTPVIPGESRV